MAAYHTSQTVLRPSWSESGIGTKQDDIAAQVVIVKKDLPVKTMAELVSYAKADPGKLNYGSSGAGGLTHYSVELFQARTGIKAVHIPFKGGAPSTAAVVSGEVDFSFANMTDGLPQVQAGSVRWR
jgi:tripartite-type tricarboxylate transporter receptor subunit TctC